MISRTCIADFSVGFLAPRAAKAPLPGETACAGVDRRSAEDGSAWLNREQLSGAKAKTQTRRAGMEKLQSRFAKRARITLFTKAPCRISDRSNLRIYRQTQIAPCSTNVHSIAR